MNIVFLCLGLFLYIITALDIIKTTFSTHGGGKITNLVSKLVWSSFFAATGKNGRAKFLEYAGPAILISILLSWVLSLWVGFFLILMFDKDTVVNSTTLSSASALEKLYYAGFTLSSLGVGDYKASNNLWRIMSSISAFSGLAFITAAITYFVPLLSAVTLQNKLSLYISSMGATPQQILINSWNGKDFSSLYENVSVLCQLLMQHTMNHHSYPVIHYYHTSNSKLTIAPSIVLLDETLQLLLYGVKDTAKNQLKLNMLQTALTSYQNMVKGNFIRSISPKEKAPVPEIRQLDKAGIPTHSQEEVAKAFMNDLQDRRKLLSSILEMDGWSWNEVYQP